MSTVTPLGAPWPAIKEPGGIDEGDPYAGILAQLGPDELELLDRGLSARGHHLLDPTGKRVGKIVAVLVDRESGRPQWLAVHVTRHRRDTVVGVAVAGLSSVGLHYWTPFDAGIVRDAPIMRLDFVSARMEQALCRHYGTALTRGAGQGRWERRATCSRAFRDPSSAIVRWLPAPRGPWN